MLKLRLLFSGLALAALSVTSGCAQMPAALNTPVDAVGVAEAYAHPDAVTGKRVRWGGTIAAVENRKSETWVEVVARDLQRDGRPEESDRSQGRFLAQVQGFLDPAIYTKGRVLTVVGRFDGQLQRAIGEYAYRYPVVKVEAYHLWEPLPDLRRYDYYDPFWYYDPWFYPYHYPYWRRWPHR